MMRMISIMVIILMTIIIHRKEIRELRQVPGWCLIYGRRKTGKTFLVQHFLTPSKYFFINRNGSIYSEELQKTISWETLQYIMNDLKETDHVVIDEFHRLGDEFLDVLHRIRKRGKLTLISSTLALSKHFFGSKSPILGFFAEFPLNIIDLDDVILVINSNFAKELTAPEIIELSILGREPWTLPHFIESKKPKQILKSVLKRSLLTIPSLIGEIFTEEERQLSRVYEGILRAVGAGKRITTEISSRLYQLGLIKKDDPSLIQSYLHNLCKIGILKRIKDHGKKRFHYHHVSSLSELFYYADEKYAISERRVSEKEWDQIIKEKMPQLVEKEIREALALNLGCEERILQSSTVDVDGVLVRFKKIKTVIEVKWKEAIRPEDLSRALKNMEAIQCDDKILITKWPLKENVLERIPPTIKVMDAENLINFLLSRHPSRS